MKRNPKRPPGHIQHHVYDLLTGNHSRKLYLPVHAASKINLILKHHGCSIQIYQTVEKSGGKDERSN